MSTVIQVENISKQYRLGIVGTNTIKDDVSRLWARLRGKEDPTLKIGVENMLAKSQSENRGLRSDYVWALKDINFSLEQGEILGIIGKNGAGKSTLLKILSKVTAPTTGKVKVKGRIASLLEVGTGFHPELSGRENIFLNGAILGMTKTEIRSKFDEIVDFSGVENYIDTPVKRYSSGMYVRLAFAVAAHLDPEILIVDEVLAVGDAEFQKKALGKMKDVSGGQGRTVLFVSHNMAAIENLCARLIILNNGALSYDSEVTTGIKKYLNSLNVYKEFIPESKEFLFTDDLFTLLNFEIRQNGKNDNFSITDEFEIIYKYIIKKEVLGFRIGFDLIDNINGMTIFRSYHDENNKEITSVKAGIYCSIAQIPPNILMEGTYVINVCVGIHSKKWIISDMIKKQFTTYNIGGINKIYADKRPGVIMPKIEWQSKLEFYENNI
ncbi:MAG TPA: ABC transporter ATP-binding protein [Bacteroidales bacterium]|nr:ABC transporter ATP-binding protein [Bacteroidales bacterium]